VTSRPHDTQYVIRNTLPLLALIALGAFLRFYRIGANGLWLDEAFSIWMGRQPVGQMLDWLARIDQHPPLYYLLLHLWMHLGDGEAVVRALSTLCSTLTIPTLYLLGRRLAGRRVGLLATLILAISPFHVYFAQEARMYALLALNASLALYGLARLLTDPRAATLALGRQLVDFWREWRATHRRPPLRTIETDLAWLAYVIFTAATLLTHNTAVFLPLAANLLVLGLLLMRVSTLNLKSATFLRNWLLAQAGVLLLWSPWLPAFISQSLGVYREFWLPVPTLMIVVGTVLAFVGGLYLMPLPAICVLCALCTALILLGLFHFRRAPVRAAFLLFVFATPILGELLVSQWRPIFYERTMIWASLPLYVLLGAGICGFSPQRRKERKGFISLCPPTLGRTHLCGEKAFSCGSLCAVVAVLVVSGLALHTYYTQLEKEQWDDAAALVAEHIEPGDLILFSATWIQIPFDYYLHRLSDVPVVERGVPVDLFDRGVLEPKMAESDLPRLRELVRGRDRVWLVYSHNWYTDPHGLIPLTLGEGLDLRDCWEFCGVQVWLYAAPPD
jgi:mannosyltransferase